MSELPTAKRVGIFGGSFNPPHVAHVLAVTYVLSTEPVDEVFVVPVFQHPFSKDLTSFEDRFQMCLRAFGGLSRVTVSAVERELGGDSLTLRTIEHLAAAHPTWSFRLIIGSDVLPDLPKWHRFERIAELAPPIVLQRNGHSGDSTRVFLPELSSTAVRRMLADGDQAALYHALPTEVRRYIADNGLYRTEPKR